VGWELVGCGVVGCAVGYAVGLATTKANDTSASTMSMARAKAIAMLLCTDACDSTYEVDIPVRITDAGKEKIGSDG